METGTRQLTLTDLNTVTTTKTESLGARGETADGRIFRYVGFGGTSTINPGQLCVSAATTANYQTLAITAVGTGGQVAANLAAGSTTVVLTNGATAVTQDQFAEGFLEVKSTANGNLAYKIRGNSAAAGSGYITVYLDPREPLRNAASLVPGTDTANLNPSPFAAVAPSTTLNSAVGLTTVAVPNTASVTNYGWVQSGGPALVLNDAAATLAVGVGIAQSGTVAGSVVVAGATSSDIGQTRVAITASTAGPARLTIDL